MMSAVITKSLIETRAPHQDSHVRMGVPSSIVAASKLPRESFEVKKFAPHQHILKQWLIVPAILLAFCIAVQVRAQQNANNPTPQNEAQKEENARPAPAASPDKEGPLMNALNLSDEQRMQIALIRQQTEPEVRETTMRLRRARRALDEAIYSADANDALIEERAKDFAAAQIAITRLRAFTELKIRRVLTPSQLNTLVELRRRAAIQQRQQRLNKQQTGEQPRPVRDGLRDKSNQHQDTPLLGNERRATQRERRNAERNMRQSVPHRP